MTGGASTGGNGTPCCEHCGHLASHLVWCYQHLECGSRDWQQALLDYLSVDAYVGTMYNFISGANGGRVIAFFIEVCTFAEKILITIFCRD
jgi:hypothetical protein